MDLTLRRNKIGAVILAMLLSISAFFTTTSDAASLINGATYSIKNDIVCGDAIGKKFSRKSCSETTKLTQSGGKIYATITFTENISPRAYTLRVGSKKLNYTVVSNSKSKTVLKCEVPSTSSTIYAKRYVSQIKMTVEYGIKLKPSTLKQLTKGTISTFTVNSVKSSSTKISGKGISKASVKAYVGSKTIGSSTADSKGNYSMKISKQKKGTKIKVVISKSGYSSKTKYITVK